MFKCIKKIFKDIKSLFIDINNISKGLGKLLVIYSIITIFYLIGSDAFINYFDYENKLSNIIHIVAVIGMLIWGSWLYIVISFIKKSILMDKKRNKDDLSFKIASVIGANIDHQLRSPLVAVKGTFTEIRLMFNKIIKISDPNGNRDIDKLMYGCKTENKSECKTCNYKPCQEQPFISQMITNTNEIIQSLEQMENTLELLKGTRRNKKMADTDLYNIINNAIMIYRMLYKQNINFEVDEEFKRYKVTEEQASELVNVFNNHISNSIDAKAFFVAFKFKEFNQDTNLVKLLIIDDGLGIPKEMIPHIWQYKKSSKGDDRGFGMYLCKELLQSDGGDERLYSTSEEGTVLEITYPVIPKIKPVDTKKDENDK